jgi:nucleoside-diphosphate-sugar epimerase
MEEKRGVRVSGMTRSVTQAAALRELGLDVFAPEAGVELDSGCATGAPGQHGCSARLDGRDTADNRYRLFSERLSKATHFISTVAPQPGGDDPILAEYGALIGEHASNLSCLMYVSSTSVYGEHDGARVNEETLPRAPGQKGLARLAAESSWRAVVENMKNKPAGAASPRFNIMRLAGIYGPGRSALDTLLNRQRRQAGSSGTTTTLGSHMLTSRIHVDDIVDALVAAMFSTKARGIYNLADDLPASRADVFDHARALILKGTAGFSSLKRLQGLEQGVNTPMVLGMKRSEQTSFPPSRRDLERTSKRVCNKRLKTELLPSLRFPTYHDGLAAIAAELAENSWRRDNE